MPINRKKAPAIFPIQQLDIPECQHFTLDNGIPVFYIGNGDQDAAKIEIVFDAGRPDEVKKSVARATTTLLKDGSKFKDSSTIANSIDFHGGVLSLPVQIDSTNLTFSGLHKHLNTLIQVVSEFILQPVFPQYELDLYVKNNIQRLQVELSKPEVVSYRKFTEYLFGSEHPYGYNTVEETFMALERNDLISFHHQHFGHNNCTIFVSGKVNDLVLNALNQHFGQWKNTVPLQRQPDFSLPQIPEKIYLQHQQESLQSSLKIGKRLFNRQHPDYSGMMVLQTILGGYFGSRLMSNIREDKGLTYNIYSSIDTLKYDGYFYIGTETSHDTVEETKAEIYKEIQKLREEPIEADELEMVRNYLMGNFLTLFDGPFNAMDTLKSFYIEKTPLSVLHSMIETTKSISPQQLQNLANQYFEEDSFWEVVVGR